jgi:hypothetical protein
MGQRVLIIRVWRASLLQPLTIQHFRPWSKFAMKGAVAFFAMVGTSPLLRWAQRRGHPFEVGDPVRVRARHSPLTGQHGKIAEISPEDPYGPYLVQFSSGLQFRYRGNELAPTSKPDSAVMNR